MKSINWKTAKGADVELSHVTRETVWVDGYDVEAGCNRLEVRVAGQIIIDPSVCDHPQAGHALEGHTGNRKALVPIGDDVKDDVDAMVNGFWAAKDAAWDAAAKAEQEMSKGLCPRCGSRCYGDCQASPDAQIGSLSGYSGRYRQVSRGHANTERRRMK